MGFHLYVDLNKNLKKFVKGFIGISGFINPVVSKCAKSDNVLFLVGDNDFLVGLEKFK